MAGFFDGRSIDVPCPGCGRKHAKTIGWIKSNDVIPCGCGANIQLDKSQFVSEMRKAEAAIASIPRKITIKF